MNSQSPSSEADYPSPRIPLAPVISNQSLTRRRTQKGAINSLLDAPYKRHVTSGRAAISLALEDAGIGPGDEVLIPAFHCESMISPIRWRQATPLFYQIEKDTKINLDDIKARYRPSCKAVIATHYFGFMQDFRPLRQWCDRHGVVFIEDCAHAFFGAGDAFNVGEAGHYAIASSMKFFPIYDGGLLVSYRQSLANISVRPAGLSIDAKSLLNTLEKSIGYGRLGWLGWVVQKMLVAKNVLWAWLKSNSRLTTHGPASSEGAYDLDETWIHVANTRVSQRILAHSNLTRICQKRRENYLTLDRALSKLNGVRPLFPDLPAGCVPLVYPLYFDDPSAHFARLKQQGVPIWRFGEFLDDEIDDNNYPNSKTLSRHVFQFPCHQELLDHELQWMIDAVSSSLTGHSQGETHGLDTTPYQPVS